MMQTKWEEAAKQQQADEQARRRNVTTFTAMFLSLGADCIKIAGTAHDAELAEAKGIAASRWEQLLNLEAQIPREEANLAVLERGRVADSTDEFAGPELRAKKDRDHRDRVEARRAGIKGLREEAKRVRAELESYTAKRR
jgi:S-methylmethionine-dependent homocysteine/selenocysteine methylase